MAREALTVEIISVETNGLYFLLCGEIVLALFFHSFSNSGLTLVEKARNFSLDQIYFSCCSEKYTKHMDSKCVLQF